MKTTRQKVLDSNVLKLIAILAMTIDHITWAAFPGYPHELLPLLLHLIGRITCPIMCFFIAEGYHYTRDINKYTARLFVFALISHFAYVFASNGFIDWKSFIPFYYGNILNQTGVMWSLVWGLIMLRVVNSEKIKTATVKTIYILLICIVTIPSDWSCIAALCVLSFGAHRGKLGKQATWMLFYVFLYATVYYFAIDSVYGILQMGVVLSIPFLALYNGKRGKNTRINIVMKWVFYLYYPIHLFIIGIVNWILG